MISVPQPEPLETMPGRDVRSLVVSVGIHTALLVAMMFFGLIVFVPVVLMHCAVRNGHAFGWMAFAVGTGITASLLQMVSKMPPVGPHDLALNLGLLLEIVLSLCLPALLLAPLVQRNAPFGRVLMAAVILGALGLVATELIVQQLSGVSLYAVQLAAMKQSVAAALAQSAKNASFDAARFRVLWEQFTVYCQPAIRVLSIVVSYTLSLVMFGRLRAWRDFLETRQITIDAPYLFRNLSLPEWLLLIFVGSGLSTLASGVWQRVGLNVLIVVAFLYMLQGLAIFRSLLVSMGANFGAVLFAYGALALLTVVGISPLLLSIAGLFDSFFDYRHFNRKDSTHEGHSD